MKRILSLTLIGLMAFSFNAFADQHGHAGKDSRDSDKKHMSEHGDRHEKMAKKKDSDKAYMRGHDKSDRKHAKPMIKKAVAVIAPTAGNKTHGVVYFKKVDDGIKVSGKIENISPGKHGFHVHQWGDITAEDGLSAGGHFNPADAPHAGPDDKHRHVGDLGNIEANDDSVAEFSFVDKHLSFYGKNAIIGRSLIVHAEKDDLESQPTGDAGPRIGMGVIGVADPKAEK